MSDPRPRSDLLERVLSASAALVAISALAVSVYQTKITREQQKMSAWPYVIQGNTNASGYSRVAQNVGLGPALVRSFVIEVDGLTVHHWSEVRSTVEAHAAPGTLAPFPTNTMTYTSTLRRGSVLLPGAPLEIFHVAAGDVASRMQQAINDERVRMRLCYCSLYEDCWIADTRDREPVLTRACPSDATREFDQ